MPVLNDDQLLAAVQSERSVQTTIHSPTSQPTARFAVAAKLPSTPKSIDDPAWKSVPSIGSFFMHQPADGLSTAVDAKAAFTDSELCVRIVAEGHPPKKSYVENFWMNDTLEIFIDPTHDHYGYFQFVLLPDGRKKSSKCWKSCGTQRWEIRGQINELSEASWSGEVQVGDAHWAAYFRVPFDTLGARPEPGRPFGFNVLRQRCEIPWEWYTWNFTHRGAHSPWGFGDLYFAPPSVHVDKADLGELRLWENRGILHVRNLGDNAQNLRLDVAVKEGKNSDKTAYEHSQNFDLPASSAPAKIPFVFPFDPDEWKYQNLQLSIRDAGGRQLWAGSYRAGYETGWMLHIDDRREGAPVPNPSPSDPDFLEKKRAYIIRQLPKFVRRTTTQGAPSDFTLQSEDGTVIFNLMQPGALQRIADYIESRYDNDLDRLLGATMFIHQRALVSYAHVPTSIASKMSPLSIIRLGNAMCSSQAEALCGIVEKMRNRATGRNYQTRTVTYFAHVVTVTEFEGKWVHLDASLGRWYFLPGTTTLATMEELIEDPSLAAEQSPHLAEMMRKSQNTDLPFYGYYEYGVWPPGAPAE